MLPNEDNIFPGLNISKTVIFCVVTLFFMALVTENPIMGKAQSPIVQKFQSYSTCALLISTLLSLYSIKPAWDVHILGIDKIESPFLLCRAKILISVAVIIFYIVLCTWIILLGGLLTSPYSALLSISPIIFFIQYIKDSNYKYPDKIKHSNYVRTIKILSIVPLCLVGVILVLFVIFFLIEEIFGVKNLCTFASDYLAIDIEQILKENWYRRTDFTIYVVSTFIVFFTIFKNK